MKDKNGKKIMVKYYFAEHCDMDKWLKENPQYKMVDYKFTFQYGYILYYVEKQNKQTTI